MRQKLAKLLFAVASAHSLVCSAFSIPDKIIEVNLSGVDHQTYIRAPFEVPHNVKRISVAIEYTGKSERTVVDVGLIDQAQGLVGWSGGNKKLFTVSEHDATPSYSPRVIEPGTWFLLFGIPNIRSDSTAVIKAEIYFSQSADPSDEPEIFKTVLRGNAAWYKGDLHTHSGHSDGSCASVRDRQMVPCPVFKIVDRARGRKLDFVAITDHNTGSQANSIRELQPYYDDILLLSGRELTSFYGHANVIGVTQNIDFQARSAHQGWNEQLSSISQHAFVSINHPIRPGGEFCMGCAWLGGFPNPQINGVEIANGDDMGTHYSGLLFWERLLESGEKLTAVAGSDNHNPDKDWSSWNALGRPFNWIYADRLSQVEIIDSLQKGKVVLDFSKDEELTNQPPITLTAIIGQKTANIGDRIYVAAGQPIGLKIEINSSAGKQIVLHSNPGLINNFSAAQYITTEKSLHYEYKMPTNSSWVWLELRDEKKNTLAMTNPIYFSPSQ